MIIAVRTIGSGILLGKVKLDGHGKVLEGDELTARVVSDVLRRYGGDLAVLDGWTNGYVKLAASA
jgi:hypothetical protein